VLERYEVLIFDNNNGDWVENLVYCDGSLLDILQNRVCLFPMDVIRNQYAYSFQELVRFKLRAKNFYGWALDYSPINTIGARVRKEPDSMGTIFVNAFETSQL
jgi:hypothetical protein